MAAKGARTRLERLVGAALGTLALLNGLAPIQALAQAPPPPPSFGDIGLRGDDAADQSALPLASNDQNTPAFDAQVSPDAAPATAPSTDDVANYGAPRPQPDPTLTYSGRPKSFANPLPALQPYGSAAVLRTRGGPPDVADGEPPPTVSAVASPEKKKKPTPEVDPFAPLGVDVGMLRLTPYVESDLGYDSNPQRVSAGGKGSPVLRGEVGLSETSLGSVNQLTSNLEAGYSDYLNAPSASRPDAAGKMNLRVDVSRETALNFELRGTLSTQQPGSPGISSILVGRPLVASEGTTAGVSKTFSRLTLSLNGLIDRTEYQDGRLSDGTIDPLSSENYTGYTLQGRAGYEITPGVIPFAELDADTRKHDETLDAAGYARSSNGLAGQIGTTFELTRILTGNVSGGYLERNYQDARLGLLKGPTFDSSLVWAATPLTTFTLKGVTTIGETTVTNASGEVSRVVSLGVAHALLRNLTLTGLASYEVNSYPGSNIVEHDYLGTLGLQYSLSRSLVVKGTFTQERLSSTTPGSSYTASTMLVGLRLQR